MGHLAGHLWFWMIFLLGESKSNLTLTKRQNNCLVFQEVRVCVRVFMCVCVCVCVRVCVSVLLWCAFILTLEQNSSYYSLIFGRINCKMLRFSSLLLF